MLIESHMPVGDVAQSCGFTNVSYFNRLFRQKYGLAPTAYRREGISHPGQF